MIHLVQASTTMPRVLWRADFLDAGQVLHSLRLVQIEEGCAVLEELSRDHMDAEAWVPVHPHDADTGGSELDYALDYIGDALGCAANKTGTITLFVDLKRGMPSQLHIPEESVPESGN